jgi:hypothetical protein
MSAAQHHMQGLGAAADSDGGSYDQQYDGGSSDDGGPAAAARGRVAKVARPSGLRRADSGSIIVTGGEPVEARDEVYGSEDARTMSPRRSGEEVDRLGENARRALLRYLPLTHPPSLPLLLIAEWRCEGRGIAG